MGLQPDPKVDERAALTLQLWWGWLFEWEERRERELPGLPTDALEDSA